MGSAWGVLGEGQPEGSGHPRAFRCRPPGCRRGLGPPPRPRRVVLAGEGMRPTLGAGGWLVLSVAAPVGSSGIRPGVVGVWRCGGMTRRGDGTVGWWGGQRRLGGRWCGIAVVGQLRCSPRRGSRGTLGTGASHTSWAAVGRFGRFGCAGRGRGARALEARSVGMSAPLGGVLDAARRPGRSSGCLAGPPGRWAGLRRQSRGCRRRPRRG